jgi:hypothetical protein
MIIKGKIQDGLKEAAKNTIPKQKPYFKEYIQDIDNYYDGTINLLLEKSLMINRPDIVTKPIEWTPGFEETFGFLRIKFETIPIQNSMPLDALIYIPYLSPHFPNQFYKEILVPKPKINLDGVEYCNIIIDKKIREIGTGYIID